MTTPSESENRRSAAAAAGLVFGLAASLTYLAERLYEQARGEASDPTLILKTLHTVYYWRVAIAAWWGGVVALIAYTAFRRAGASERRTQRLALLAAALAPALALAFYLYP